MDGPNANLKFQKLLINGDVLTSINKLFLNMFITCSSFCKGATALNFDVDQYALQSLTNCAYGVKYVQN